MPLTDQLCHIQTAIQVKLSMFKQFIFSMSKQSVKVIFIRTPNIFASESSHCMNAVTKYISDVAIKHILEIHLLPYLSFSDIVNSVRFCWNFVLLLWHLKQHTFISKTVSSIVTTEKTSFLIHTFGYVQCILFNWIAYYDHFFSQFSWCCTFSDARMAIYL